MDITLDLHNKFRDLKKSLICQCCNTTYDNPVVLSTCGHTNCKNKCLDLRKNICSVCKNPFNSVDVADDSLIQNVLYRIKNIEKLFQDENNSDVEGFELVISKVSMKRNPTGETHLHIACKKGNLEKVKELVKSGVDINMTDWANWTPLHEAVQRGHLNCVEYLVKNGALVNVPGQFYTTPLHKAVAHNFIDIAESLIKYGADVDAIDYAGFKPLERLKSQEFLEAKQDYVVTPQVFVSNETVIYTDNLTNATKLKLMKRKAKFATLEELITKDNVTHYILTDDKLDFKVLISILKGIFIVSENWINEYSKTENKIAFDFLIEKYKSVNKASIKNNLLKNPRLFDGINFHIVDHEKTTTVLDVKLTKKDLTSLVQAGGGKIVVRPPALRIVEGDTFYPFHATKYSDSWICCNYIIYNEANEPELLYKMKELKHKSSKWLIECILNFKIVD